MQVLDRSYTLDRDTLATLAAHPQPILSNGDIDTAFDVIGSRTGIAER